MNLNIIKLTILIMSLAGIVGCNKTTEPLINMNCAVNSFMEGVSNHSSDNNYYIIKGIVLGKSGYGLNIRLVEDLKGNFPKNRTTFIVWGDDNFKYNKFETNRLDDLTLYNNQDVLIMLLTPTRDLSHMNMGYTWFERPNDYCTLSCTHSVVKLSDDYVTGFILPYEEKDALWKNMSLEELISYLEGLPLEEQQTVGMDKIPYNDFQKKINDENKNYILNNYSA